MWYGIRWRFQVVPHDLADDDRPESVLEAHLSQVMEELVNLDRCNDDLSSPMIGADVSTGQVDVDLEVHATSPSDALDSALTKLRAAVHAAGGFTGSWDKNRPKPEGVVEYGLVEVEAEPVPA